MSDEQMIYLSPEEELTDVRERLEKVEAKSIILVIPPQTKLRSHVGWRLLHARARELGKNVLVISADRQVRVVVKAAGFQVADSLESPPSQSRSGSGSRISRSGSVSRGPSQGSGSRAPGKGASAGRQRDQQGRGTGRITRTSGGLPRSQSQSTYFTTQEPPSTQQGADEDTVTKGGSTSPQSPGPRGRTTFTKPPSTPYPEEPSAEPYGHDYDFHIDTTPSVHPVVPQDDEEEDDALLENVRFAQRIRQAAGTSRAPERGAGVNSEKYRTAPIGPKPETEDPFTQVEDFQPTPLPEQRGAFTHIDELDDDVPDVVDVAPGIGEAAPRIVDGDIEDLGDQGEFALPQERASRPWNAPELEEPGMEEEEEEEEEEEPRRPQRQSDSRSEPPSRVYGVRPRNTRSGRLAPPPRDDAVEVDELPTRIIPPAQTPRPSSVSPAASNRPSQSAIQKRPAAVPSQPIRPGVQQKPRPGSSRKSAPTNPLSRPVAAPRSRRSSLSTAIVIVVIVLLFILVGALGYIVPSATVSFTLATHNFSQALKLSATATSKQDTASHTLPAQTLTFDKSATGQGTASGTTKVGIVKAKGSAEFTNNGSQSVVVPTGTIITTRSGVQFTTTAEPLITAGSTYPVNIEAVDPGVSGNVGANTITVIPPESITKIGTGATSLAVSNPNPITGGGVGNAALVVSKDITQAKATLDPQLQDAFKAWLAQSVQPGDAQGKPIQQETVSATPAQGATAPNGTFSETVTLHTTVLVVRAAAIQSDAQAELNASSPTIQSGYALVPQQPVQITKLKSTPAKDGQSIALTFTATGQVAPQISEQYIRTLLSSKLRNEALTDLNNYLASRVGNAQNNARTSITISPSFFPWVPFRSDRIQVNINTTPASKS